MFELYVNGNLFGVYNSRLDASQDAFEIMLDSDYVSIKIIETHQN